MRKSKMFQGIVLGVCLFVAIFSLQMQACFGADIVNVKKVYNVDFKITPKTLKTVLDTANGAIRVSTWDKLSCQISIDYKVPSPSEKSAQDIAEGKTKISYQNGELTVSLKEFFDYFRGKNKVFSNIKLNTSNGRIILDNVSAKNIKADTSNGAIEFKGKANYAEFDTSCGAIDIVIPKDENSGVKIRKADTSVGKVNVNLDNFNSIAGETKNFSNAKYKMVISADTSVGAITIEAK